MALICTNPDCRLAETGKCVDGFEIGQCPHVKEADESSSSLVNDETPSVQPKLPVSVPIAAGEILSIDEATDVLRARKSRVITVIGPLGSGKTTFALTLYEALQSGPFHRWNFAGSMTLPAFEKRCHFSRLACGGVKPETIRTALADGLGFLHLDILDDEIGYIDILISDRSGEFYENVAASVEGYDDIHEVLRADYLLFFVDGKKLGSDARHGLVSEIKILVRSLVEGDVIRSAHRIGVVLTKYDKVDESPFKERIEKDFDSLVQYLRESYGSKLASIDDFKIAARPDNEEFESRYGIIDLLQECFKSPPVAQYVKGGVGYPDRAFLHLSIPGAKSYES